MINDEIREATDKAIDEAGGVESDGEVIAKGAEKAVETPATEPEKKVEEAEKPQPEGEQAETPEPEAQKPAKSRTERRFDRLTSNNKELQRERDYYRDLSQNSQVAQPQAPQGQQLPQDQQQAVDQLKSMLGMDKLLPTIDALKQENERLTRSQQDRLYREEKDSLTSDIEKMGLETNETVEDIIGDIESHIQGHPVLSTMIQGNDVPPGVRRLAYESMFFGKNLEVGKKVAQKENIEFQNKQKNANSEHTSQPGKEAPKGKNTGNVFQDTERAMKELGMGDDDF